MKFFFNMGEGTPFPLDILCKNLVNFYKFSRFISEKINSFYQNMFQLMFEKKNFLKFHTFCWQKLARSLAKVPLFCKIFTCVIGAQIQMQKRSCQNILFSSVNISG